MALFGGSYPTATAYKPTVRDRIANAIVGDSGPYSMRSRAANLLVGSEGLGSTGNLNIADMTGLGMFLGADEAGRQIGSGHPLQGAATMAMALPLPLAKGAKAAKGLFGGAERAAERAIEATPAPKPPIVAYHGSPHGFDRFSTANIGTGEGAQAYGRGLYFAENEGVAQSYRDALKGPDDPGHMYEVGINAEPEHFLDWDKPLNQQPAHVRKAVGPLIGDHSLANAADEGMYDANALGGGRPAYDPRTGQSVYRQLGSKADAAQKLQEAGVAGIKYLDQGSRGAAGNGTRNYVVFNDKIVDILKRYGIAAPALLGAGAAYSANQQGK